MVTGRIEQGRVHVGDDVEVVGLRPTAKSTVTGVEMFHRWGPGDPPPSPASGPW